MKSSFGGSRVSPTSMKSSFGGSRVSDPLNEVVCRRLRSIADLNEVVLPRLASLFWSLLVRCAYLRSPAREKTFGDATPSMVDRQAGQAPLRRPPNGAAPTSSPFEPTTSLRQRDLRF